MGLDIQPGNIIRLTSLSPPGETNFLIRTIQPYRNNYIISASSVGLQNPDIEVLIDEIGPHVLGTDVAYIVSYHTLEEFMAPSPYKTLGPGRGPQPDPKPEIEPFVFGAGAPPESPRILDKIKTPTMSASSNEDDPFLLNSPK